MSGILHQASCVAIAGTNGKNNTRRALLIEGEPGSGKSSLALALIDRGALLIGDDGVRLTPTAGPSAESHLLAEPPPNISGLLEVRNVGLVKFPITSAPLALIIRLSVDAQRLPDGADHTLLAGYSIPAITLHPDSSVLHLRAEQAMARFGLPPVSTPA